MLLSHLFIKSYWQKTRLTCQSLIKWFTIDNRLILKDTLLCNFLTRTTNTPYQHRCIHSNHQSVVSWPPSKREKYFRSTRRYWNFWHTLFDYSHTLLTRLLPPDNDDNPDRNTNLYLTLPLTMMRKTDTDSAECIAKCASLAPKNKGWFG